MAFHALNRLIGPCRGASEPYRARRATAAYPPLQPRYVLYDEGSGLYERLMQAMVDYLHKGGD